MKSRIMLFTAVAGVTLLGAAASHAAAIAENFTGAAEPANWTAGSWGTASNWSAPGNVPNNGVDTYTVTIDSNLFSGAAAVGQLTVNLDGARTITGLVLGNNANPTTSTRNVVLAAGTGGSLAFASNGTLISFDPGAGNPARSITAPITQNGGLTITSRSGALNITGNYTQGANQLTVGSSGGTHPGVLIFNPATFSGSGSTLLASNIAFAPASMSKVGTGNLNLQSGTFVLDGSGASGPTFAQFLANRSANYGAGANQWQLNGGGSGGGFAARGTGETLLIDNVSAQSTVYGSTTLGGIFNLDIRLGTTAVSSGGQATTNGPTSLAQIYGNAGVNQAQNTTLTARRAVQFWANSPGYTGNASAAGTFVQTISGRYTDSTSTPGVLTISPLGFANSFVGNQTELLFARPEGTSDKNDWTGNALVSTAVGTFNTGRGGLALSNTNRMDSMVRFANPDSLPTGNSRVGSALAYIAANVGGSNGGNGGAGFLLTGKDTPGGYTYDLGTANYKIVLANDNGGGTRASMLGSQGGNATLRNTEVILHQRNLAAVSGQDLNTLSLLTREDPSLNLPTTLTLGATGAPVRIIVATGYQADAGVSGAATTFTDVTTFNANNIKTFVKRGVGTLALSNVQYTNLGGTALSGSTLDSNFIWQLGLATGGVGAPVAGSFEGAVRETTATGTTGSLEPFRVTMVGGVLEIAHATSFTRSLDQASGLGAGEISLNSATGGGFAAFGGNRTVNLNGGTSNTLTWGSTAGFFNQSTSASTGLIFGSTTTDSTAIFQNPINLNGGTRTIYTVKGVNNSAVANLTGQLTSTSNVDITDMFRPDGSSRLAAGTIVFSNANNTYSGTTTVTAGTLLVNGNHNGGNTYSLNALDARLGVLGGTGALTAAVNVNANTGTGVGAAISPGDPSTAGGIESLGIGNLSMQGAAVAGQASRLITQVSSNTLYDQLLVTGTVNLNSNSAANASILDLTIAPGFTGNIGDFIKLIDNNGTGDAIIGQFQSRPNLGTLIFVNNINDAYTFSYRYAGPTGSDNDFGLLIENIVAIPEPAGLVGLLAMGSLLRCRRHRNGGVA